jgi:hypothetical protein
MDRACLYEICIEPGMTDKECMEVGAYTFRGQLRIRGCMKSFARRDVSKRHVDNPNLSCIGHMDTYYLWIPELSGDLGWDDYSPLLPLPFAFVCS